MTSSAGAVAECDVATTKAPGAQSDVLTWFRYQAAMHPDRVAVVDESRNWTYAEMLACIDRVAGHLRRWRRATAPSVSGDVAEPCFVGLSFDHSAEAIVAMMAVMNASMAFVPLDPDYPADRLAMMIADAPIPLVLTSASLGASFADVITCLSDQQDAVPERVQLEAWMNTEVDDPGESVDLPIDDVAYVMYTSGSTGRPKGVCITHRALTTYCLADVDVYRLRDEDRTLQFSTLNFDIAIEEIFPPLISGSAVVVRPPERSTSANELSEIVTRYGVTAIHLATAYWHSWVELMHASGDRVPDSLRLMVVTGEKVSVPHFRMWMRLCDHDVLWCNAYGPTEATVSSTVFIPGGEWLEQTAEGVNMPIGKPLKGYDAYVLDEQLRPVSPGRTGQLFIGGPALAKEYLHRDDLTSAAFVQGNIDGKSRRLYATGDLARWMADGNIEFGGRLDHQIKLGSYRIEPGEIEAACNECESVMDSVVGVAETDGKKTLHVHLAIGEALLGRLSTNAEKAAFAAGVADDLRERLPVYMIPSCYVLVDQFPHTVNGKIDRRALPDPSTGVAARRGAACSPQSPSQRRMASIWEEVLGISDVSIHDDFFLLGGSSLLVTQVIARWTQHSGEPIPVRDFFANPTIASITHHLCGDSGEAMQSPPTHPKVSADFFEGGGQPLHGTWYSPLRASRSHSVIFAPAWGHEWTRGYRNIQQMAVLLSQHGFDVLRFDHPGVGQSSGCDSGNTFASMTADMERASDETHRRTGNKRVSLIGHRCGATWLVGAIEQLQGSDSSIEHLVLWDPVVDGNRWLAMLDDFHAETLVNHSKFPVARQDDEDVDEAMGMLLTDARRREIESLRLDLDRVPADVACHVVCTDGVESGAPGPAILRRVADNVAWDRLDCVDAAFASPGSFARILEVLKT
ncbi:MAG: amino acid adenylation domain-containing protein [Planctomycetota bacterium]